MSARRVGFVSAHLAASLFAATPRLIEGIATPTAIKPSSSAPCSALTACLCAATILLLSACSEKPLIVSADTSCEKFRHISATDAQIKVFADNWAIMESYADQIIAHNLTYDAACTVQP